MSRPEWGVLLMTYGSPASLDREEIRSYLGRVRGGREPDPALVDEFTRRYRAIGGSPLVEITQRQATALSRSLDQPVVVGMRFSEPSIATALAELAGAGVTRAAGIVLSPQYSPLLMDGYTRAIDEARTRVDRELPDVAVAGAWHEEPALISAIARRVTEAIRRLPEGERPAVRILMTAHSLPRRVAEQEPVYLSQLRATAELVAARAGLPRDSWTFCWQSAGHEPGEWMKPDFVDLMPRIASDGGRSVLVVPVQFLADHLEVLYDIDIGAREQAERYGLAFHRIESLNEDDDLIDALASVARRAVAAPEGPGARRSRCKGRDSGRGALVASARTGLDDRLRMAEQRQGNRGGGRAPGSRPEGTNRDEKPRDAGAYIGRMPERQAETIPGGVGRKDVRVSAVASQPAPVRGDTPADGGGAMPEGHREGVNATDDVVREAGQNR